MKKVRVGVIGVGFGQRVLVPAFRSQPVCEVTAIGCSDHQRAGEVARRLGIPHAFGSWQDLVAADVDAIAVAVSPKIQAQIIPAALERGLAVFAEKPLADSLTAAEMIAAKAAAAGLPNLIDFEFLEVEAWKQTQTLLASGRLGTLRHVVVTWIVDSAPPPKDAVVSWKDNAEAGGGVLNNFVSHTFYYLERLVGPIVSLQARLARAPHEVGTSDTFVSLILDFAAGTVGSVAVGRRTAFGSGHRIEFSGDNGVLILENKTRDYMRGFRLWKGERTSSELQEIVGADSRSGDGRIDAVASLVERFVSWIQTGHSAVPNFAEGLRVQALIDAARRSAAGGDKIFMAPHG